MRSLIKHLGKRIKNETSMTSSDLDFSSMHYNNGNLDNGNVIPMDLDFNNQPTVKSEPMDFESGLFTFFIAVMSHFQFNFTKKKIFFREIEIP